MTDQPRPTPPAPESWDGMLLRIAELERLMAQPVTQLGALIGAKGCVCPVGAEKTCMGIGCPRRAWSEISAR